PGLPPRLVAANPAYPHARCFGAEKRAHAHRNGYPRLKSWVTLPQNQARFRGAAPAPTAGRERRVLPMKQLGRVSADAASVVMPPEATLPNARLDPPPQLG